MILLYLNQWKQEKVDSTYWPCVDTDFLMQFQCTETNCGSSHNETILPRIGDPVGQRLSIRSFIQGIFIAPLKDN